jgi:hypothetical protein
MRLTRCGDEHLIALSAKEAEVDWFFWTGPIVNL